MARGGRKEVWVERDRAGQSREVVGYVHDWAHQRIRQ